MIDCPSIDGTSEFSESVWNSATGDVVRELYPLSKSRHLPSQPEMIFNYWKSIRAGDFAPAWDDFDMSLLPPKMLPWSVVVDVKREPTDFIYRFFGTSRVAFHRADYTGMSVRDMKPASVTEKIFSEYSVVLATKKPIYAATKGVSSTGQPFQYEYLRLPISDGHGDVGKIYAVGFSGEGPEADIDYWRDK